MERRLCKFKEYGTNVGNIRVDERESYGYFHCWMDRAEPVRPELCVGGHQGGQYAQTFGIIEKTDGQVVLVFPTDIQFIDEEEEE